MANLLAVVSIVLLFAAGLEAQTRTYAGTFSSEWLTVGKHGHDQPLCAEPRVQDFPPGVTFHLSPDCNPVDFARGNLDNSIGFRAGGERDFFRHGPLSLVGGIEGSLSYTEYNLTQTDFIFASLDAVAGLDVRFGPVVIGARAGAGPFVTSDGEESGFQHIRGMHVTLPLRPGAAIRINRQSMGVFRSKKVVDVYGVPGFIMEPVELVREPKAVETSILLVTSPEYVGSSGWEFSAFTGVTSPGGPIGSSRMLRASTLSGVSAFRELPWYGLEGRFTWVASAHESIRPTTFLGYDGNFRSKTIHGFGLGAGRTTGRIFEHFSLRYGTGVEVADWRDEHQLLTRDGEPLVAGIETAIVADGALRWHVGRNLALEASVEKLYWSGIDLGETRVGFGLVVTR